MKTGEGKTLVSTLPVYLNALGGQGVHLVTVNDYLARRDAEWMGQVHRFLGLTRGPGHPRHRRLRAEARRLRLRRHLRDQHRVRLRLPPRQHGPLPRRPRPAGPRLRHRRRGRLHPHRRGPDPAHHLRPRDGVGQALLPVRRPGPDPHPRRGLRGRRREEDRRPHRRRHRQGGAGHGRRQHVRPRLGQLRPPADPGPAGQGALPPGQGLSGGRRRGEDRRRVHRPDPGRAALVRRSPPGRRGQGAGPDRRGEPHLGHRHPAELLPALREARAG